MKRFLSLLMCYVFLQAETFALRGGPGGAGNTQLQGSYSAILIQTSPLFDIQGVQVGTEPGNGLGLMTLTVPSTGPALGNILLFDAQTADSFLGRANGLSNPTTGVLTCLVAGTQFIIQSTSSTAGTTGVATTTETISGRMTASKSKTAKAAFAGISGTANLIVAGIPFVTVVGTTTVRFVRNGEPATYDLVGYQTSSSDAAAASFDLTGSTN